MHPVLAVDGTVVDPVVPEKKYVAAGIVQVVIAKATLMFEVGVLVTVAARQLVVIVATAAVMLDVIQVASFPSYGAVELDV